MICFVGPLPPPVHGMAAVNADIVARLAMRMEVTAIDTSPGRVKRGVIYHMVKGLRALGAFAAMARARARGAKLFYGSVDDGFGGLWTSCFAGLARLMGMKIYLHHHSFRYLGAPTFLMRLVTRTSGRNAHHITLCDHMAARLRHLYPDAERVMAVANCVDAPAEEEAVDRGSVPLAIGMLANLSFDKGIGPFVSLLEQAIDRGLGVRGILAGAAATREAEAFLAAAVVRLGPRLEWRGAVAGAEKERFFKDIDAFVFPTQYQAEAYPLVLLEALVRAVPVMAPARGCIGTFGTLESATIVPLDQDFVRSVLPKLELWSRDRGGFEMLCRSALAEGLALNKANAEARSALVDHLLAEAR